MPKPKPALFKELIKLPIRIEVQQSSIHGDGIFATTFIDTNEIVFAEGTACCYMAVTEASIAYAIACLPDTQRDAFNNLHGKSAGTTDGVLMQKFMENAIELPASEGHTFKALFLAAGKLNHSPDPNAKIYWDQKKNHVVVEALKKIYAGDEVTISYCCRRREFHGMAFPSLEFDCYCKTCQQFGKPRSKKSEDVQAGEVDRKFACLCSHCADDNKCGVVYLIPKTGQPEVKTAENILTEEMMVLNIATSKSMAAAAATSTSLDSPAVPSSSTRNTSSPGPTKDGLDGKAKAGDEFDLNFEDEFYDSDGEDEDGDDYEDDLANLDVRPGLHSWLE